MTIRMIRVPVSFSLAGLVTITLFWFLGVLIGDVPESDSVPVIPGIDFTIKIPDTPEVRVIRIPEPPRVKPPQPPDQSVVRKLTPTVGPGIDETDLVPPDFFTQGIGAGPGSGRGHDPSTIGGSDRAAIPQVRMEPEYPQLAKARGIEGWITFRFTVTREGRVKDIQILAGDPPQIWEAAAIRAVSTWRYQPRLVDGVPVEQQGVTATYRFRLDR